MKRNEDIQKLKIQLDRQADPNLTRNTLRTQCLSIYLWWIYWHGRLDRWRGNILGARLSRYVFKVYLLSLLSDVNKYPITKYMTNLQLRTKMKLLFTANYVLSHHFLQSSSFLLRGFLRRLSHFVIVLFFLLFSRLSPYIPYFLLILCKFLPSFLVSLPFPSLE